MATDTAIDLHDWLVAICMQGGLEVEGDETTDELSEAITYLAETVARRVS